ncbi:hypothetical protein [Porphyromonas sp. oral taxon 278]|uniref:hypothetical protein n=1 Tax=Porphyromonas sp. oral taxon 278 TaxID=712437 RepID=UPI00260055D5|nr:hypothetical protein [Porphyromonas sp. oral taxon 278]
MELRNIRIERLIEEPLGTLYSILWELDEVEGIYDRHKTSIDHQRSYPPIYRHYMRQVVCQMLIGHKVDRKSRPIMKKLSDKRRISEANDIGANIAQIVYESDFRDGERVFLVSLVKDRVREGVRLPQGAVFFSEVCHSHTYYIYRIR